MPGSTKNPWLEAATVKGLRVGCVGGADPPPIKSGVDGDLGLWLALTCFGLAWVFWCGWWLNRRNRQEALLCFWYSVALEFAGFMTLTVLAMSSDVVIR